MNSNNPVFNRGFPQGPQPGQQATFSVATPQAADLQDMYNQPAYAPPRYMNVDDVVVRTGATLGVLLLAGLFSWTLVGEQPSSMGLVLGGSLVGLVLGLVISFKQSTNPALILSYAAVEGVVLGAVSRWFNTVHPGVAIQAVIGTAGVFAGMLFVYKTGAIRVTPKFTRWLLGALVGVLLLMVANAIAFLFTPDGLSLRSGGPVAIGFSLICIGVAALSFLLDFDMVDQAIRRGTPEKFAWYAAFGLTVTLVWLYLEILRLLGYLRD